MNNFIQHRHCALTRRCHALYSAKPFKGAWPLAYFTPFILLRIDFLFIGSMVSCPLSSLSAVPLENVGVVAVAGTGARGLR